MRETILNEAGIDARKSARFVQIAKIDHDGFALSRVGPLGFVPEISEDEFQIRARHDVEIVADRDGVVGVRKYFRGDVDGFLRELRALHELKTAACNVPAILDFDFDDLSTVVEYIPGCVLREELAKAGATVRDRDLCKNPWFNELSSEARQRVRIGDAQKYLYDVVDRRFVEQLFEQVTKIHSAGFLLNDIKYGNVIIHQETREPWLIDFDLTVKCPDAPRILLRRLRDRDIEAFNLHFGTAKLTYRRIAERIGRGAVPAIDAVYTPAYIGDGLGLGRIWSVGSGIGEWDSILTHELFDYRGKRILELGSNNGAKSLHFLRNGATAAVGIESNEGYVRQGLFLKEAFEWHDNRKYDFRYVNADLADIPVLQLGRFDIAVAPYSICCLDDEAAVRTIRHVSGIAECMVLQGNLARDIGRGDKTGCEKASIEHAVRALECNGFTRTRVVATRRYPYPLVIGRK